jgi:hypothetical protein
MKGASESLTTKRQRSGWSATAGVRVRLRGTVSIGPRQTPGSMILFALYVRRVFLATTRILTMAVDGKGTTFCPFILACNSRSPMAVSGLPSWRSRKLKAFATGTGRVPCRRRYICLLCQRAKRRTVCQITSKWCLLKITTVYSGG